VIRIYKLGEEVLREKAVPIEKVTDEIKTLIGDMFEAMIDANGVGLAAPQVGKKLRLFVAVADDDVKRVFINPQIVSTSEEVGDYEEGCLSIPKINEKVPRPDKIKIKYLDETFREHEDEFEGYFARVIQHECDHIDGKMFVDHISPLRKQLIKSKLADIVKRKTTCSYKTK